MAHFAITDTESGRFIARERLTREALGLAGAEPEPLRIWVKDWAATGQGVGDELTLRLDARDDAIALALDLGVDGPSRRARRSRARHQRSRHRQRLALLLRAAARRERPPHGRRRNVRGRRARVARSRMEHELARSRHGRVGTGSRCICPTAAA